AELAARVGVGERQLQRIGRRRIGLSPKWLLQRRRLQDAAARLGEVDPPALADLATELGYADQAHFTRDFTTVLGRPPGRFAREHHPRTSAVSKPAPTTHPPPRKSSSIRSRNVTESTSNVFRGGRISTRSHGSCRRRSEP